MSLTSDVLSSVEYNRRPGGGIVTASVNGEPCELADTDPSALD